MLDKVVNKLKTISEVNNYLCITVNTHTRLQRTDNGDFEHFLRNKIQLDCILSSKATIQKQQQQCCQGSTVIRKIDPDCSYTESSSSHTLEVSMFLLD